MHLHACPALYALFVWWFSTGVILYLDGLPPRTFPYSMAGATAVLGVALWGVARSAADPSVGGVYTAFTCALLAWAWMEFSFYTGYITGPRRHACGHGCKGLRHFGHAVLASLYHELAILAGFAAVLVLTWNQPNQTGLWTLVVMKWMHQSARLNVLLGVPNVNEHFLPPHLAYLRSFLARKPMNALFPLSVSVSTVVAVLLFQRAVAPGADDGTAASYTFLGTLMGLAILEHWFLVLPLPTSLLWNWSLGARRPTASPARQDPADAADFAPPAEAAVAMRRPATRLRWNKAPTPVTGA